MRKPVSTLLFALLAAALLHCGGAPAGEDGDFRRAYGYYTLQEYKLAIEALTKYAAEYPKSERADQASLLLAESYYQLKQYREAADAFGKFTAAFPESPRRGEALLRAAKVNFLIKNYDRCLAAAAAFIKEHRAKLGAAGAHPELPQQFATALYFAGEGAYGVKDPAQAKAYWDELRKTWPDSKLVADASEGLGWIHFDAKEYDLALASFSVTANAANHPRAAWSKLMAGRALAALKKTDEALAAFNAAPTLTGSGKDVEAEAALRTAEVLLGAGRKAETVAAYRRLATEFPAVPTTLPALAAAALTLMEAQQQTEALALADLYLNNPNPGPDRPVLLRLRARALLALNDEGEALKAARKAAEEAGAIADAKRKAEEHPAALMLLAEVSGAQAADVYRQIVAQYAETRFGLAARYEIARLAGRAGKNDEALKEAQALLESLAKAPPGAKETADLQRDALFAAAEFAFRKLDYKQAEQYLKSYVEAAGPQDPRADDVARKLARCRYESGDAAGAAAILDAALKTHGKSPYRDEMLYLRALSAAKSGAAEDAVKFNDMAASEFPASPFADDALYDAATLLYKDNKHEPAIARLTTLLEQKEHAASPLADAARQLRAAARLQAGKHAEALADAEALLKKDATAELNPRLPAMRLIKALALLGQPGKEAEAEAALAELIQAGPADAPEVRQGLVRRAYLRFAAKRYAEAKTDFAALGALLDKPAVVPGANAGADAQDVALRLALCHKELKETAEAKRLLEKLAAEKLEGLAAFEAPFQLGNIAFEAQEHPAAAAAYERALAAAESVKDLPASARSAACLNLAWCYKRLNEPAKAEQAFANVVKCDPKGPYVAEALYERGRLLDELNKPEDAAAAWKEVYTALPESPQAEKALFLRSQKLAKAGRFADAAPGFEEYLKKYATGAQAREAYCGLGECHLQAGNAAGAREAFTKALGEQGADAALDEAAERALLGLSELNLKQGEALAGKKMALRILTESPNSPWRDQAFFMAAQCSEQLGEPEKAIGYYRKLLAEYAKSAHADAAAERLKALGAPK
jgi:TolA-binding protein